METLSRAAFLDSIALVCPEKKGALEKEPLSRGSATRRVQHIAANSEKQSSRLVHRGKCMFAPVKTETEQAGRFVVQI